MSNASEAGVPAADVDDRWMLEAIKLAEKGRGYVEPNPMVGCVIVRNGAMISSGYHQAFGQSHAEINALNNLSADIVRDSTLYVTLEPCSHIGKTGPCVDRLIELRPKRVCIGCLDPNPLVHGRGIARLRSANIDTAVGVAAEQCNDLIAPFRKLLTTGQPYVIAKWAMTLDGKIASSSGHSKWISNEQSLQRVHQIRGQMDAIVVGSRTVALDNPRLTARPPGPRTPVRIVMDSNAKTSSECSLVQTARDIPTLIVCQRSAKKSAERLLKAGCELLLTDSPDRVGQAQELLVELGKRQMTNVLLEGGGTMVGSFFDLQAINYVHVFIAPKLVGGLDSPSPIAGSGRLTIDNSIQLDRPHWQEIGNDFYVQSKISY